MHWMWPIRLLNSAEFDLLFVNVCSNLMDTYCLRRWPTYITFYSDDRILLEWIESWQRHPHNIYSSAFRLLIVPSFQPTSLLIQSSLIRHVNGLLITTATYQRSLESRCIMHIRSGINSICDYPRELNAS